MLPQYQFIALLGRGGMGAVYKAVQVSLEREVAIKVLPADLCEDEDANFVERFKNEARMMAKMKHPAIVDVYEFGETAEGLLYIAMEFIDGTDVAKMIHSQGRLPPDYALAITAHVCDALAFAHGSGVIHRDIKPANILIHRDGTVKVADFGLAKQSDPALSGLTKTNMAVGTPDFLAPEALIPGLPLDGRADLYAVGVMLYQMLTGELPRGMWTMPVQMLGTDPRFDAIIGKAMQTDREARYSSANEIRRDLDVIMTTPLAAADTREKGESAVSTESDLQDRHGMAGTVRGVTGNFDSPRKLSLAMTLSAVVAFTATVILWLIPQNKDKSLPANGSPPPMVPTSPPPSPSSLPGTVVSGSQVRSNQWIPVIEAAKPLQGDDWQDGWLKINKPLNILQRLEDGGVRLNLPPASYLNQGVRLVMKPLTQGDADASIALRYEFGNPSRSKLGVHLSVDTVSTTQHAPVPGEKNTTGMRTLNFARLPQAIRDAKEWRVEATASDHALRVNINGQELLYSDDVSALIPGGAHLNLLRKMDANPTTWVRELSFMFIDSWTELLESLDLQRDVLKGFSSTTPPRLVLKGGSLTNPGKTPAIISFPFAIRGTEYVIEIKGARIRKDYSSGFVTFLLPVGDRVLDVNFNSSGEARRNTTPMLPKDADWAVQGAPLLRIHLKTTPDGKDAELKVRVGDRESEAWHPGSEGLSRHLTRPLNEGWKLAPSPCIHMVMGATVSEIESIQLQMVQGSAELLGSAR